VVSRPSTETGRRELGRLGRLGRYELLRKLATGGMAEIYLARSSGMEGFEKYVVVKKILPQYAEDPRFVRMFLDEARLAAKLQHQNIGQVYDIGQDDGAYFFSMEYLRGPDVRAILRAAGARGTRVPIEHGVAIASGVAAALHYAHERRDAQAELLHIVHRDVSPSNIIVTYDGGVKLVDFGIARATTRTSETRTGSLKGKLAYMSPEQCLGHEVDRRSDLFSIGILLYELTTGTRLYRRAKDESDYIVMNRIVTGQFARPTTVIPDFPRELQEVILRALASKPDERSSRRSAWTCPS
jgi:serine/threonine protein kinase